MSKMGFNSSINPLIDNTSMGTVDSVMYFTSVDRAIFVCSLLIRVIKCPIYLLTYTILG